MKDVSLLTSLSWFKGEFQMPDGHQGDHNKANYEGAEESSVIKDIKVMKKIYKTILKWASAPPSYNLLFRNCTHFVNKIRKLAGMGKFSHGLGRIIPWPTGAIEEEERRKEKPYKGKKETPIKVW